MTGSILCAIDVSNDNKDAPVLKRAAQLAVLDKSTLDLVTIVPDFGSSLVGSFFEPTHHTKVIEKAKEALLRLGEEVLGSELNANSRHIVATGSAYQGILQVAKQSKATLIVIGAHQSDNFAFLLGPNAARVVRHSNCSVYVVR